MRPRLFTFDIFGTVIDWRLGLSQSVAKLGRTFRPEDMDRIIDIQGKDESGAYQSYQAITASSIKKVYDISAADADTIASNLGRWPLFPDSKEGMKRLIQIAPCMAMSNSDFIHRDQVQEQLGFSLSDWLSAEELKLYKPSPQFWLEAAKRKGVSFDLSWWHVSAYADYDLNVARELGLTCVFVSREHSRPGRAHHTVPNLLALAASDFGHPSFNV